MAMISKASLGRYSPAQGLSGPELPREGRRAGGKIEIVHGQEIDPFFADGLDLPSRGRTPVRVASASRSTRAPTFSNMSTGADG